MIDMQRDRMLNVPARVTWQELTPCSHPQHHSHHRSRRCTPPSTLRMPLANTQQWKILIVDQDSKKLIDNVVKEDDILDLNITSTLPCP